MKQSALMNAVHYKLPGAFRVVRDCCRRRSIIHGQQLKTLGLFKRNRHIFGRGSAGSLFLRWRPGGGQQTHAALTIVTQDTKSASLFFIPISASCRIFFNWFHNKWAKAEVLSLSFSQIDQLLGGGKIESLTDPDSGKKRKKRLTDVTKHASI